MSGKCGVMKDALPGRAGKCRRYTNIAGFPSEGPSSRPSATDRSADPPRTTDPPPGSTQPATSPAPPTIPGGHTLAPSTRGTPPFSSPENTPRRIDRRYTSSRHFHSPSSSPSNHSFIITPPASPSAGSAASLPPPTSHQRFSAPPFRHFTASLPHCPISPLPPYLIALQHGRLTASQLSRRRLAAAGLAGIQLPGGNLRSLRSGIGARCQGPGARGRGPGARGTCLRAGWDRPAGARYAVSRELGVTGVG
jgi:hypothetical protein